MGVLIDGEWREDPPPRNSAGEFVRPSAGFREWISSRGRYPPEPGRYHLYVSRACPWCHRILIARVMKRLEGMISVSYVEPLMLTNGWTLARPDPLTGVRFVHELYALADPLYSGRATLPLLWDRQTHQIVSNESSDIVRMMNRAFDEFTHEVSDFYPQALAAEIDLVNERVYETVNNGVYRAGFAGTQQAYDSALRLLFGSLDWLNERLQQQRYLLGDLLTEADWRLFPTLIRFDTVYHGHFKCNRHHVYEYPALWDYTREIFQMPGIAATVDLEEYRMHYYGSHHHLNPSGIVPPGPDLQLSAPHTRGR